jgi:hypothetical protein
MRRYSKKTVKIFSVIGFIITVITMVVFSVGGFSTGRYDRAKTGCECHSSTADPTVIVSMTGQPTEYIPFQAYQLTITVSGGPSSTNGGFNLEISAGTLSSIDPNVQINGPQNQATHTNPNQRSWSVDWTAPAAGSGDITFWVAANAVNGNGDNGGDGWNLYSTTISETPQQEYHTILKQGWNLISIPLTQEDQELIKVLGTIDGDYDAVQQFNITETADPWKHYKVGKPFGNDLSQINEKMGFWIFITQPGDTIFIFNGTIPTENQTIAIHPGWNLVGYPSLSNKTRDIALNNIKFGSDVNAILSFNATTGIWEDLGPSDYFKIGRGYWIHSNEQKVWEVPL